MFVTANEARHQSQGDNRSRAQEHDLMIACWRGPSQPCLCVCMCLCDVSQSLCDTLVERKCEWSRRGSVKFPSEGCQLCFRRFRAGVSCGADRVMPWAELGDDRGPAAFPSPSPAVLCIIIHSSPRPQTPPSHHLSCRCHSDFERDLSSSCPPVRSTALMGK